MGFGMNGAAMLVTRGCKEMNRLAIAMGAQPHTLRSWRDFKPSTSYLPPPCTRCTRGTPYIPYISDTSYSS